MGSQPAIRSVLVAVATQANPLERPPRRFRPKLVKKSHFLNKFSHQIVNHRYRMLSRDGEWFLTAVQSAVTAGSSTPTVFRPSYVSLK